MKAVNTDALLAALARMPARQLALLLGGVLAVIAALLWSVALRAPLAAMRAQQAEIARLSLVAAQPARTAQQLAALALEVDKLDKVLAGQTVPGNSGERADQLQLRLIGEADRAAARHAVILRGAVPGPRRVVTGFQEVSIDVEAAGSYQALVDWLREVDAAGTLAIVSFDLAAGDGAGGRVMKTRMAAYQLPPAPGKELK